MGRLKKTITVGIQPTNADKELSMTMLACNEHETYVWHQASDECSACLEAQEVEAKIKDMRKKNTQLRKDVKLLKHELVEERMLHNSTKLDAAEYLAQKLLVSKLVEDRVK